MNDLDPESTVAVVGLALRLPGASTPERYWSNLRSGVESIRTLSNESLRAAGVTPDTLASPHYVKRAAMLDAVVDWDAGYFGMSPRDASVMDPQHRVFLECVSDVLERAGHDPSRFDGAIGVFAGSGMHRYLLEHVATDAALIEEMGFFLARHTGNDKDFVATRASYVFDLRGPSLNVQTACSTSLVAIHLAVSHLLSGECDMALAGGVTVELPHGVGYHYRDGEILSPDGHCRPFDAEARGTIFGSGAGVVALRRLDDALRDGDHIHAVIRGSAVNNDGAGKVSYLAPGVDGQARVISEALELAGVSADSIGLVECHGTGTPLGDPIEVAALVEAFRTTTDRRQYCALGSVKTNIGHTDCAAGVAGFIKAVLAVEHGEIPPMPLFERGNPIIDFGSSPFYVNRELERWRSEGPRRAGVSSLGVGGTNAHVIVEQAPTSSRKTTGGPDLLVLSARTRSALDASAVQLADHLGEHPDLSLGDVAHTLQSGRREHAWRRAVVATDLAQAVERLDDGVRDDDWTRTAGERPPRVAFLFAGGGAQYAGMGGALYATEPVFKRAIDDCIAASDGGLLRTVLFGGGDDEALESPSRALPALFAVQYAHAQLWMSWGVEPSALIGHSMGQYTAATLAGVFSLKDAMGLVALRGRLFESLPDGGMLGVPLSEDALRKRLEPELSVAAVNGPELCVVSGPTSALSALETALEAEGVASRWIRIRVAAHSAMVDTILEPFERYLRQLTLNAPNRQVVCNVDGGWLSAESATNPTYWVRHLRETVRFSGGLELLASEPNQVWLELGPGHTLSTLAWLHSGVDHPTTPSMPHPDDREAELEYHWRALGRLWTTGLDVDWPRVRGGRPGRRVPLPTYPFERRQYVIQPPQQQPKVSRRTLDRWFQEPVWKRAPIEAEGHPGPVLVFAPNSDELVEALDRVGHRVILVRPGGEFGGSAARGYRLRTDAPEDYVRLVRALAGPGFPVRVLHLWSVPGAVTSREDGAFYSLLHFAQAAGEVGVSARVLVVTSGAHAVGAEAVKDPWGALSVGPSRVMSVENPLLNARVLDVAAADFLAPDMLAQHLTREWAVEDRSEVVAWRGRQRFTQMVGNVQLQAPPRDLPLAAGGTVLITGGLGGIGLAVAEVLAGRGVRSLALLGRSGLPARERWDDADIRTDARNRMRIAAVQRIEAAGARVAVLKADVSDHADVRGVIWQLEREAPAITGVIHAAGVLDDGLIQLKSRTAADGVLRAKVHGALVLDAVLGDRPLEYFVCFSSVSAWAGLPGQVDYTAANAFLDAFASQRSSERGPTLSVGWGPWDSVGMTAVSPGPVVEEPVHPWLQRTVRETGGRWVLSGTLSPSRDWVLSEHRLRDGEPLLPATAYLELAGQAARTAGVEGPVVFEHMSFLTAFSVEESAWREIRVELTPARRGWEVEVLGRCGDQWEVHAQGQVAEADITSRPPVADLDVLAAQYEAFEPVALEEHAHLHFGPRWHNVVSLRVDAHEALVTLRLRSGLESDTAHYLLHPALLDMATGGALALVPNYDPVRDFYVPIEYGELTLYGALPATLVSHVRLESTDGTTSEVARFHIDLIAEDGAIVARITDYMMKRVPAERLGMSAPPSLTVRREPETPLPADASTYIGVEQGTDAFLRLLDGGRAYPHLLVSPRDLGEQMVRWRRPAFERAPSATALDDPREREALHRIIAAMESLESVMEAAAAFGKGRSGERRILAYVVYAPGESATTSELRRHARRELPAALVPKNYIELDEIPRHPSGAIDAACLPDPFAPVDDFVAPHTEMERRLAAIWRHSLGVDRVGRHDNFFDLGGHSLLAIQIILRVQRELGVRLDQAAMVLQTLTQLASRVEQAQSETAR